MLIIVHIYISKKVKYILINNVEYNYSKYVNAKSTTHVYFTLKNNKSVLYVIIH